MEAVPYFLVLFAAVGFVAMTVAYFLVPAKIIARKNEYVKFALVFLSSFLTLGSAAILLTWNDLPERIVQVMAVIALWFFPLLFGAYMLYGFRTVKRNRHVGFFLFWAALASLPFALMLTCGIFFR